MKIHFKWRVFHIYVNSQEDTPRLHISFLEKLCSSEFQGAEKGVAQGACETGMQPMPVLR